MSNLPTVQERKNNQHLPLILLDAGHAGLDGGNYSTKGKQWTFQDGTTIKEGEFNRAIKARVMEGLHFRGLDYVDITPEQLEDVSLRRRVDRANRRNAREKKKGRKTVLISIHADAGGGKGCGSFVAPNASRSSWQLARIAESLFSKHFPESIYRGVKNKKRFAMVAQTDMPAVLFEFFFMDNEQECKTYLLTKEGRDRIGSYLVDVLEIFVKNC